MENTRRASESFRLSSPNVGSKAGGRDSLGIFGRTRVLRMSGKMTWFSVGDVSDASDAVSAIYLRATIEYKKLWEKPF